MTFPTVFGVDGGELGYLVNNLPNPDLSWEFTNTINFGVDFGMLNNRVTGSIDMYKQKTDDILQTRVLPWTAGVRGDFQQNVGKTENQGLEVTLDGTIIEPAQADGFRWDANLNFTTYKEEITQLFDTLSRDVGNGWFVGEPIDVVYDYQKVGIWQSGEQDLIDAFDPGRVPGDIRVADLDGDGIRTDNDRTVLGSLNPDWTLGFSSRFSFKGFDLSFVLYGRVGGMTVSRLHQEQSLEGRRNHLDLDYWTPNNPTNAYPRTGVQFPIYRSTMGYFDGTYWKVRNINLGYTFPAGTLSRLGMSNMRAYVQILNPFKAFGSDLVDAGGIDPEPNARNNADNSLTPGFGRRFGSQCQCARL